MAVEVTACLVSLSPCFFQGTGTDTDPGPLSYRLNDQDVFSQHLGKD